MQLRKLRSIEEATPAAPLPRLDPRNLRIAFELSALAIRLGGAPSPVGVFRFRSREEADAWRAATTRRRP